VLRLYYVFQKQKMKQKYFYRAIFGIAMALVALHALPDARPPDVRAPSSANTSVGEVAGPSAAPPSEAVSPPAGSSAGSRSPGTLSAKVLAFARPPSFIKEKLQNNAIITEDKQRLPLRTYKPLLIPNDPKASQWWTANARLEQAWDTPRGDNDTLLAVIDTGFALKHEEFQNRWHTNAGESGSTLSEASSMRNCTDRGLTLDAGCNVIDDDFDGVVDNETGATRYENPSRLNCTDQARLLDKSCNRIDDDGNGLVDDVRGWDFINFDNSTQAGELNPAGTGTHHGTYVLGAAAATGNNGKGIAGVDWGTKILPIQALDDDSYGNTLSVGRAIRYAAQQGADVISLSLGSSLSDDFVRQAVREAIAAGSVVVAASGNDGCECIVYPANYSEVIAVGALNSTNEPASFSAWGANLDILAPGVGLYTTDWSSTNQTSAYADGISGTSLATPLVSGLLTRLLSHRPDASPLQLIAALSENTNRLSLGAAVSRSNQLGFGTLDAAKATGRMTVPLTLNQAHVFTPLSSGNQLNPLSPAEAPGPLRGYHCKPGSPGATPVFELNRNKEKFFSASQAERHQAEQAGFAASLLAYTCLLQPHDQVPIISNIDIWQELKNMPSKPL
jgi:subtilisin family serine protease